MTMLELSGLRTNAKYQLAGDGVQFLLDTHGGVGYTFPRELPAAENHCLLSGTTIVYIFCPNHSGNFCL